MSSDPIKDLLGKITDLERKGRQDKPRHEAALPQEAGDGPPQPAGTDEAQETGGGAPSAVTDKPGGQQTARVRPRRSAKVKPRPRVRPAPKAAVKPSPATPQPAQKTAPIPATQPEPEVAAEPQTPSAGPDIFIAEEVVIGPAEPDIYIAKDVVIGGDEPDIYIAKDMVIGADEPDIYIAKDVVIGGDEPDIYIAEDEPAAPPAPATPKPPPLVPARPDPAQLVMKGDPMSNLDNEPVKRVRDALLAAGLEDKVIELKETAKTAADAAKALNVEQGAIVKTLVFVVGEQPVMALVAGDKTCKEDALPRALSLAGEVTPTTANDVQAATGFSIGGVAPIGSIMELPVVIDVGLKRFEMLYAAAGHPHCVFPTNVTELKRLTGGIVSYAIAE